MEDYALYARYINDIRSFGKKNGLTDREIEHIYEKCYKELDERYCSRMHTLFQHIKYILITISIISMIIIGIYNHPVTHNLFLRNMQNFIYPGFNIVRKIAVPIVSRYPQLTEYYDESCLIENPFFYVSEMDCWPCSEIQSIPDLTGMNITKKFNVGMPFTRQENDINNIKTDFSNIINTLRHNNNKEIFIDDARRVLSNNQAYQTIKDVIDKRLDDYPSNLKDTHITWRINRMKPGRILRELFLKPPGIPNWWSQSVERFLFIDESNAPVYDLPSPECSNVILLSVSGQRLIKLIPSPECQQSCRSNAVILRAGYTLWYNWWYWRPISLPIVNSTEISIQYLISFC